MDDDPHRWKWRLLGFGGRGIVFGSCVGRPHILVDTPVGFMPDALLGVMSE